MGKNKKNEKSNHLFGKEMKSFFYKSVLIFSTKMNGNLCYNLFSFFFKYPLQGQIYVATQPRNKKLFKKTLVRIFFKWKEIGIPLLYIYIVLWICVTVYKIIKLCNNNIIPLYIKNYIIDHLTDIRISILP